MASHRRTGYCVGSITHCDGRRFGLESTSFNLHQSTSGIFVRVQASVGIAKRQSGYVY